MNARRKAVKEKEEKYVAGDIDIEIDGTSDTTSEELVEAEKIEAKEEKTLMQQIIEKLEEKELILLDEDRGRTYVKADGRLLALHMLYPNPESLSVKTFVTHITDTHIFTRTDVELVYWEMGENSKKKVVKEASDVSGVSFNSADDFERNAPAETCSTSSLGRALKNLGVLSEWGPTADEIEKAKAENRVMRQNGNGGGFRPSAAPSKERDEEKEKKISSLQISAVKKVCGAKDISPEDVLPAGTSLDSLNSSAARYIIQAMQEREIDVDGVRAAVQERIS